jgi:hypothetical protein
MLDLKRRDFITLLGGAAVMRALLRQTLNYVSHRGFVAWRARA